MAVDAAPGVRVDGAHGSDEVVRRRAEIELVREHVVGELGHAGNVVGFTDAGDVNEVLELATFGGDGRGDRESVVEQDLRQGLHAFGVIGKTADGVVQLFAISLGELVGTRAAFTYDRLPLDDPDLDQERIVGFGDALINRDIEPSVTHVDDGEYDALLILHDEHVEGWNASLRTVDDRRAMSAAMSAGWFIWGRSVTGGLLHVIACKEWCYGNSAPNKIKGC